MSQLTTHILDTSKGRPAAGVPVFLYRQQPEGWLEIAASLTNEDGRIPGWLGKDTVLPPAVYKLRFEVKEYFSQQGLIAFYPFIEVVFAINGAEHYHVPLLLSPFGYSTYRGS